MDKYNRTNFMKEEAVSNKQEMDLTTNVWNDFKLTRPGIYYTIKDKDLKRPDLISFMSYGRQNYWWIIARVNNIDDWFNDLQVGDVILIPNKLDIEDFYIENSLK